ncbi:hypothetical protein C8R44DRAFT_733900 [Mycena epipterygia]|nr:hypothetical protein C8R44DRAFT_733900 [Mycena epipterygia]
MYLFKCDRNSADTQALLRNASPVHLQDIFLVLEFLKIPELQDSVRQPFRSLSRGDVRNSELSLAARSSDEFDNLAATERGIEKQQPFSTRIVTDSLSRRNSSAISCSGRKEANIHTLHHRAELGKLASQRKMRACWVPILRQAALLLRFLYHVHGREDSSRTFPGAPEGARNTGLPCNQSAAASPETSDIWESTLQLITQSVSFTSGL